MSFVKALYGNIIGPDLSLKEGEIGHTESDHHLRQLEKRGLLVIKDTYEEAEAFKFIPRQELFAKSYKALNPPEGEDAAVSLIDWENSQPTIINGVPSNYIIESKPEKEVKKTVVVNTSKPEDPLSEKDKK